MLLAAVLSAACTVVAGEPGLGMQKEHGQNARQLG